MSIENLEHFWSEARAAVPTLSEELPAAWAFGATSEHADELLALVVEGTKTGTASSLQDLKADGEAVPEVGQMNVILDGRCRPRAVIETTEIAIVAFAEVTVEHARAEGEGDRTLVTWRETHENFWRDYGQGPNRFSTDMLIVCERFQLVYVPTSADRPIIAAVLDGDGAEEPRLGMC